MRAGRGGARSRLTRPEPWLAVLLAAALLGAYLVVPFVLRGSRFPVGPDASVYLWWTALARHEGLSVLGNRAGISAVAIVASGAASISSVTLFAALPCVLATVVALGAGAFAMAPDERSARVPIAAAGLVALYIVPIAAGYYSTLGLAVCFVAALVALTVGTRSGAVLAGVMLAAAGIMHPELAALGALVLMVAAALAWRAYAHAEALRITSAVAGGVVASVLSGLALLAGPRPLAADTSRDVFLIRVGMSDLLGRLYVHRLVLHAWTYVPFVWVPLAGVGIASTSHFRRRVLLAWIGVTAAVVVVGGLTGWFPPERALSFAITFPLLGAFGVVAWLGRGGARAVLAIVGVSVVTIAAGWAWWNAAPPVYEVEAAKASAAGAYAAGSPPGTPLVFQVTGPQDVLTFFATRAANEIRAAVPPDRIRDVFVVVPPPGVGADRERRTLWARYQEDVRAAVARAGRAPLTFRVQAFIRDTFPEPSHGFPVTVAPGVLASATVPRGAGWTGLLPSTLGRIVLTAVALLVLFAGIGWGWVRAVTGGDRRDVLLAPAVGFAILALVTLALERIGLPIASRSGAVLALAIAAVPGWALARRGSAGG